VATPLAKVLKPHQVEGVHFMWQNSFSDFAKYFKGNAEQIGGCILAHNM
jgi:SNF2 family DNA or RNA helicase